MRKILFGLLGLLFTIPSWADCNLFDVSSLRAKTEAGVTLSVADNGEITVNGTTEAQYYSSFTATLPTPLTAGTYTISLNNNQVLSNTNNLVGCAYNGIIGSRAVTFSTLNASNSFVIEEGTQCNQLEIRIKGPVNNLKFKIQLERGSTATTYEPYNSCVGINYTSATGTVVQNGTPTPTNPVDPVFYTQGDMVLRKVGNYADSYDATTGKITRRVGEYIITGNEDWRAAGISENMSFFVDLPELNMRGDDNRVEICNLFTYRGFIPGTLGTSNLTQEGLWAQNGDFYNRLIFHYTGVSVTPNAENWKEFLATKYAAGTPVTIWYPLATEVVEYWPASQRQQRIRVASTKYVETQFGGLSASLAAAVQTVNTVVTNTITQAASIATLQSGKQTRPDETCPAGKKCLLVEGTDGQPHWYEICGSAHCLPENYIELEYIESDGASYIDTQVMSESGNDTIRINIDIQSTETGEDNCYAFGRYGNGGNYVQDAGGIWGNGVATSQTSSRQKTNIDAIFENKTLNLVFNNNNRLNRSDGYSSPGNSFFKLFSGFSSLQMLGNLV